MDTPDSYRVQWSGLAQKLLSDSAQSRLSPIHFIPVALNVGVSIARLDYVTTPWGAPLILGHRGFDSDGAERLVISYEWPIALWPAALSMTKNQKEETHLRRFVNDYSVATGSGELYDKVTAGADPPDFLCQKDDRTVSVECTQFGVGERRKPLALLEGVRRKIMREEIALSNLRGFFIYMVFDFGQGEIETGRPPHPNEKPSIDSLVEALKEYKPKKEILMLPTGALPEVAPDIDARKTPHGAMFYAVPFVNGTPATDFCSKYGFELGLAYTSIHEKSALLKELSQRIDAKDNDGVDHLLVSVGAPDERGICYPAESLLVDFALADQKLDLSPKHLKEIYLHFWSTGLIFRLWPNPERFTPVHHGGYQLSWYSFQPV